MTDFFNEHEKILGDAQYAVDNLQLIDNIQFSTGNISLEIDKSQQMFENVDNGQSFVDNSSAVDVGQSFIDNSAAVDNGRSFIDNSAVFDNGQLFIDNSSAVDSGQSFIDNSAAFDNGQSFIDNSSAVDSGQLFIDNSAAFDNGRSFIDNSSAVDNGQSFIDSGLDAVYNSSETLNSYAGEAGNYSGGSGGVTLNFTAYNEINPVTSQEREFDVEKVITAFSERLAEAVACAAEGIHI